MGTILHANAKTTPRIRKEIQESNESIAKLALKYNLNPKTVHRWKRDTVTTDKKSGAKIIRSSLSLMEQQVVCEFRRVTKLPLDDCFIALKEKIPSLTRSNLHRCLQRNNLSVLPKEEEEPQAKKKFKEYEIGFVHVDITQVVIEDKQKLYLFVGIDRASKYVFVALYEEMTVARSVEFLEYLIEDCPFKITRILTDNGAQFTYELLAEHLKPKEKVHPFDVTCKAHNIEHRLTKFKHPWTNGQVEIFNKTIKNATTKTYHYETTDELKRHLMSYLLYYNHQKKLKALKFKSPYAILLEKFDSNPDLFKENPYLKFRGLNN